MYLESVLMILHFREVAGQR